ncbi:MAG: biotin/lipoyl-binding protein [Magnetococcales bacterium]|nr:biotin/lipoyl-binding protein [Magnetococcales bacterium]
MGKTFSENWFRVAGLRLALRATVFVRYQEYRGEPWYLLHDRITNSFHRVAPSTWRFIDRLRVEATVDEIWRTAIEEEPVETPGQEEVFQLLTSLYNSNLLIVEAGTDERRLLERGARKKRKPFLARLTELMFFRIPLVDPEPWLRRGAGVIRAVFSRTGAVISTLLLLWGGAELVLAGERAWSQAANILQWNNVLLLYLAVFVTKGLHELGHAGMCSRFGGEVRTMGFMLLMFTPLPYVDVSASWGLRDRYRRAAIGAAGMVVDLVVAAVATVVWAHSPPGAVNELAYNLMFTTAIYTVVFNLNPLMRFDGYYILSDLIGMPNLHERCKATFHQWFQRRILGVEESEEDRPGRWELTGLIGFYLGSNLYRLFVMGGIVIFIADAYLGVGLVVAVAMALTSFVLPLQKQFKNLKSPLFRFQQRQLLQRAGAVVALLLGVFVLVPVPDNRVLPGVVEAERLVTVHAETAGVVVGVPVPSGRWVLEGTVLAELANQELQTELRGVEAQLTQTRFLASKSVDEGAVDLSPVRERLATLEKLRSSLSRQLAELTVRAVQEGFWVAPELFQRQGTWLAKGTELGQLVDDRSHYFKGVIHQEAAVAVVEARGDSLEVRLDGEVGRVLTAHHLTLVPHSRETLPSAALGPGAGGGFR